MRSNKENSEVLAKENPKKSRRDATGVSGRRIALLSEQTETHLESRPVGANLQSNGALPALLSWCGSTPTNFRSVDPAAWAWRVLCVQWQTARPILSILVSQGRTVHVPSHIFRHGKPKCIVHDGVAIWMVVAYGGPFECYDCRDVCACIEPCGSIGTPDIRYKTASSKKRHSSTGSRCVYGRVWLGTNKQSWTA